MMEKVIGQGPGKLLVSDAVGLMDLETDVFYNDVVRKCETHQFVTRVSSPHFPEFKTFDESWFIKNRRKGRMDEILKYLLL